jgi:hypothetical protein
MALSRAASVSTGESKKAKTDEGKAMSHKSQSAKSKSEKVAAGRAIESQSASGDHHLHPAIFATPRCVQCARQLPGVPFMLHNILCRECYGLERYPDSSEQRSTEGPLGRVADEKEV